MSPTARTGSLQRVRAALRQHGLEHRVQELPGQMRSAAEAAAALGCDVSQIAKSLVFRGCRSDTALLVVASGADRVDESRLAAVAGEPVERPGAAWVRERTGFAIGGVAPVAHPPGVRTLLDAGLLELPEVWAAAGTPSSLMRLTPDELLRVSGGEVSALAAG